MMKILKIGKFHRLDEQGNIQNCCVLPIQQLDYKEVVDEIIQGLLDYYGTKVHSIYIRGSVAKGTAIQNVSDIDLVIILQNTLSPEEKTLSLNLGQTVYQKYDFVKDVEFFFQTIEQCKDKRLQFLLKTQCACIYGNDIIPDLPDFPLNNDAKIHSLNFSEQMEDIHKELLVENNVKEIEEICRWMMKRIIRTGFETVMLQENVYTRDLYPNYKVFCKYHPAKTALMRKTLRLAIEPTSNKTKIMHISKDLVPYIETCIETSAY